MLNFTLYKANDVGVALANYRGILLMLLFGWLFNRVDAVTQIIDSDALIVFFVNIYTNLH